MQSTTYNIRLLLEGKQALSLGEAQQGTVLAWQVQLYNLTHLHIHTCHSVCWQFDVLWRICARTANDVQPECLPIIACLLPQALSSRHVCTAVISLLRFIIMLELSLPISTCLSSKQYNLKQVSMSVHKKYGMLKFLCDLVNTTLLPLTRGFNYSAQLPAITSNYQPMS